MPWYTLDELCKMMEPQMEKDQKLMKECVKGIGKYAAQWARKDPASPKVSEMRDLVNNIASYWGLDGGSDDNLQTEFLDSFDSLVASGREAFDLPLNRIEYQKEATIKGLFRFCFEMAACQGLDAKGDIEGIKGLIRELDSAWELPYINLSLVLQQLDECTLWLEESAQQQNGAPEMKL